MTELLKTSSTGAQNRLRLPCKGFACPLRFSDPRCGSARAGHRVPFIWARSCSGRRRRGKNGVRQPMLVVSHDRGGQERLRAVAGRGPRPQGRRSRRVHLLAGDGAGRPGLGRKESRRISHLVDDKGPGNVDAGRSCPSASDRANVIAYLETLGRAAAAAASAPAASTASARRAVRAGADAG